MDLFLWRDAVDNLLGNWTDVLSGHVLHLKCPYLFLDESILLFFVCERLEYFCLEPRTHSLLFNVEFLDENQEVLVELIYEVSVHNASIESFDEIILLFLQCLFVNLRLGYVYLVFFGLYILRRIIVRILLFVACLHGVYFVLSHIGQIMH